jgi:penicillin-binding protein 2
MLKKSRIIIMSIIVFAIIIGYAFQLMQDQVVNGDTYRNQAAKSTVGTMSIVAPRGEILDRYGRVLATSTIGYSIVIERPFFPSSSQLKQQNDELLELTNLIGQDGGLWEDSLPISTSVPYKYNANSKSQEKSLIKYINTNKAKKAASLPTDASASAVMDALKVIYKTQGYSETQQRTLCGIRYEMADKDFSYTNIYTLAQNVSFNAVTKIDERSMSLPGVAVQQVPVRNYPDGTIAPNIVGLTGPIQAAQLAEYKSKGYSADDIIGQFGIEESMENYLHGTNGTQQVEMNSNGDVASTSVVTQAKPGDNIVLTIDDDLQVDLQNMLPQIIQQIKQTAVATNTPGANAKGAAAVVLNVKTGEVLAMANYPTFDLNTYNKDYSSLANNPLNPLYNRSIQGTYTPGSTFKPIMAVSGLMNGVITSNTKWNLPSYFTIGTGATAWTGKDDEGMSRPNTDVETALAVSSNIFFFTLGNLLGINRIDATANIFGIGQKTGIELPGESSGQMSSIAEKKVRGLPWYPADSAQASIGQLDTVITPLQLANYVSTLVKGGTQYQVHVVKQINSYDNSKILVNNSNPTIKSKTVIPASIINTVKQGMLAVTEGGGTAYSVFGNFKMQIGGKTGTAQINLNNGYNGVFICFAPFNDPEIAIATVVEYGHNGFQTAPVAKEAIQKYFNLDANGNPIVGTVSSTKIGTLLQ